MSALQDVVLTGLIQFGHKAWMEVGSQLAPEMFTGPNEPIFKMVAKRNQEGLLVDQFTMADTFPDSDHLDELCKGFCQRQALPHYVKDLVAHHVSVREMELAGDLASGKLTRDEAIKALRDLGSQLHAGDFTDVATAMKAWMSEVEDELDTQELGLQTGLVDLDRALGGIRGGNLMVIAGRPGMGKTALALNIALKQTEGTVLIFELEMSTRECMDRMISTYGVDHSRLRNPKKLTDDDWPNISKASMDMAKKDLQINDMGGTSIGAIESMSFRAASLGKLSMIMVDYLQLVTCKSQNRLEEVSEVSRRLKALAKNLKVPLIALAQLNRSVEGRFNPVPKLSDLRESGQIEQDADQIVFIHRPEVYDEKAEKGLAEAHIKKNRHGPQAMVPLSWRGDLQLFRNYTYTPVWTAGGKKGGLI